MSDKKKSDVLISQIEHPGRTDLRKAMSTKDLEGKSGETVRSMARALGGVFLGTPVAAYKDLTADKLSDEDKNQLRREVTRGYKGKDEFSDLENMGYKKGGAVKASSASRRADGIAQRGKTRGRLV